MLTPIRVEPSEPSKQSRITIDTMESLDESDPEPEIDIAPKFKRKGYFQRQDTAVFKMNSRSTCHNGKV